MKNRNWLIFLVVLGLIIVNSCKKDDLDLIVKDIDGNIYHTVAIGTQVWMKENLKTTQYNDGTPIPLITDDLEWGELLTPGYCWYDNDEATNKLTYGALYNWYAVNTGKLCPIGWHVSTDADWKDLTNFINVEETGGRLKAKGTNYWREPNKEATNVTGFTALPGGGRYDKSGFANSSGFGYWWSSDEAFTNENGWYRELNFYSGFIYRDYFFKTNGFSVRCVKDY